MVVITIGLVAAALYRGGVVKWSDQYATGVEQIDRQHKMLFKMSEDYGDALTEGEGQRVYGVLLESLDRYARAHFGAEEQCMYRYRCPVAEKNSEAHRKFMETLAAFRQRYAVSGFNRAEAQRLVQYVDDWLANHIGRIDTQLKPCIENSQP